jgi:hypothetical protein
MSGLLPRALAFVVVLSAGLAACSSVPERGAVHEIPRDTASTAAAPFDFQPAGPRSGATPAQVVDGFITAQQATPVSTFVAREFLTVESAATWAPDASTLVFEGSHLTVAGPAVTLSLERVARLDAQGRWLGPAGPTDISLTLVREEGEWRISDPPDALIIPTSHFESRFQEYSLYFFDPTGRVLVPEPVFVPWGVQAPTRLIAGLLAGPVARGYSRTYFPDDTRLDISAPVTGEGIAEVPLSSDAEALEGADLDRAMAQLAWTLRQISGVTRMRVSAGDGPLDVPGMESGVTLEGWSEYDPTVSWATTDLFGLRDGAVVRIRDGSESPVSLPGLPPDVTAVGADLTGQAFALVDDESVVYRATLQAGVTDVVFDGVDVTRPVWDIGGDLWILDRVGPAQVSVVSAEGVTTVLPLNLPGGAEADAFALSRDGSRLILASAEKLWMSRVRRTPDGAPTGLVSRRRIVSTDAGARFVSVAWVSPTRVVAVSDSGPPTLVYVGVDGVSPVATRLVESPASPLEAQSVVSWPGSAGLVYVHTAEGALFEVTASGSIFPEAFGLGLLAPTYVG